MDNCKINVQYIFRENLDLCYYKGYNLNLKKIILKIVFRSGSLIRKLVMVVVSAGFHRRFCLMIRFGIVARLYLCFILCQS